MNTVGCEGKVKIPNGVGKRERNRRDSKIQTRFSKTNKRSFAIDKIYMKISIYYDFLPTT